MLANINHCTVLSRSSAHVCFDESTIEI